MWAGEGEEGRVMVRGEAKVARRDAKKQTSGCGGGGVQPSPVPTAGRSRPPAAGRCTGLWRSFVIPLSYLTFSSLMPTLFAEKL